ncbi:MAG: hypothetical protein ABI389_05165 [Rhodanobacter sp.]
MTVPGPWKLAGAAVGLIVAGLAWNGVSQYLASRHADEITEASARAAVKDAQQAQAQAQQRHDELAAHLQQQRAELATSYRQIASQAREYQVRRAVRVGQELQEMQRVEDSYRLDKNQQCTNGIVINRRGSSYSEASGKDGQPIRCRANKANVPLR